jgi:hypothetical protein
MPNGDPDFHLNEQPKLEAFFEPLAEVLTAFAQRHNVKLQKYYHQAPSWDFTFRHPQSGVGKIDVHRYSDDSVFLISYWWYDDYDLLTRFGKRVKHEPIPADAPRLSIALESSLRLVVSWQFGQWDDQYGGFDSWKQGCTKEQFEALSNDYPVLDSR